MTCCYYTIIYDEYVKIKVATGQPKKKYMYNESCTPML